MLTQILKAEVKETMPAYTLMRLVVLVLALGSCLTPPAGGQGQQDPHPVVEIYQTSGRSSEPRFTTVKISLINQAMLGVDPLTFDQLGEQNSGLKDQIFNAISSNTASPDPLELRDFIGKAVQDVHCAPLSSLSMSTLYNYNAYRDTMRKVVHFESDDDIMVGSRRLCTTASYELASGSREEEQILVEFFRLGGEVVLGEAHCRTHTVSVNLNTKPSFTENFFSALKKISSVAADPVADKSRKIFQAFVDQFGTHFQDTTYFGSRLLIMKLFAKKAANYSESAERHRCVSSSFTQSLRMRSSLDDIVQHFSRDVTQCDDSVRAPDVLNSLRLSPSRILTVGTLPLPDQDATLQRPVPIQYRLEKISQMFQEDWFASLGCGVNGTVMQEFFENMTSEYQNASLGAVCAAARKTGCGYNSNCSLGENCFNDITASDGFFCMEFCKIDDICPDNTVCVVDGSYEGFNCKKGCQYTSNCANNSVCVDDNSEEGFICRKRCSFTNSCPPKKVCVDDLSYYGYTCEEPCTIPEICASDEACYAEQHSLRGYICVSTKPGRAVIFGGVAYDPSALKSVEHVNFKPFPDLPVTMMSPAAARAGEFVVACEGRQADRNEKGLSNKCYKISTTTPGSEWETIPPAPFTLRKHSAVTIAETKIWFMNNRHLVEFNGETLQFTTIILPFDARDDHCSVTNGTHAYVVGAGSGRQEIWVNERAMDATAWRQVGRLTRDRYFHACLWYGSNIMITGGHRQRSDVEMFNTETGEVWAGQDLLAGEEGHQMMLLDGMPTVMGGWRDLRDSTTFKSFSLESNRWEKLTRTLASPRVFFVLVEV